MATVVSFINMKGGVGKTTLAFQIAHFAADVLSKRVLAIDLDPQANLSQSVLGPQRYFRHLQENRPTVMEIFDGFRPPSKTRSSPVRVRVEEVIVKGASAASSPKLGLIASRLQLMRMLKAPRGKQRTLAESLSEIEQEYDLIVIDCPPTESVLTEAAYAASRYIFVPVKPELLGAIGLPLLESSLTEFRKVNPEHELDICGIGINFFPTGKDIGPEARRSIAEIEDAAREHSWPVYSARIMTSRSYPQAARWGTPVWKTSHVHEKTWRRFFAFAKEFFESIGLQKWPHR